MSSSEAIKLGNTQKAPQLDCLIGALIIGAVGGFLGGLFIRFNNYVNIVRKKILKTKF